MAKKQAKTSTRKKKQEKAPSPPRRSEAYEAALRDYASALELLHKGDFQQAMEGFKKVEAASGDEPELAERARTYLVVCARKLAPATTEPGSPQERYCLAVVLANDGQLDEAIELLNQALQEESENPTFLYARASARALQGNTEAAVADLRHAVNIDYTIRYQASNDPDFEKVRDDAAFIDVIEPTTAGA